jgi:hypothetical protein
MTSRSKLTAAIYLITGIVLLGLRLSPILFNAIGISSPIGDMFSSPLFLILGIVFIALGAVWLKEGKVSL